MSRKLILLFLFFVSLSFFILGLLNPIMGTEVLFGLKREDLFLTGSVRYFFNEGEVFIGLLILFFTFVFPIFKYLFVGITLAGFQLPKRNLMGNIIELINKWAMLDVFVVALVILNMKFDSLLIASKLKIGTTFFAASILLLMICSWLIKKWLVDEKPENSALV